MKSFPERLVFLRREVLGYSQAEFARRVGVSRGAVANWEVGGDISRENLSRVSLAFDVSLDWLEKGRGIAPQANGHKLSENTGIALSGVNAPQIEPASRARPNASANKMPAGVWRQIPVYGQAVAGVDGEFLMNGDVMFYSPAPSSVGSPNAYAVRVAGESMSPRYFDGELVYVDPDRMPRKGDFVVVQVTMNEHDPPWGYVKQFVRRNTNELVLCQYNPAKELVFPNAAVVSVHVIVLAGTA
jgi:phage repressor protein C with HTH and peptisase S24 domain